MSLYPTLGNEMLRDAVSVYDKQPTKIAPKSTNDKAHESQTSLISHCSSTSQSLYPVLSEYFMGLNLLDQAGKAGAAIVEKSPQDTGLPTPAVPGQVTNGLRRLKLCKDAKGRVGLLVSAVGNGIFVSFVLEKSPAALGGLRFGDQILQINDVLLAGLSADKVHSLVRKLPVNDINLIVRDRPFERTISMHKDHSGHCGFQFRKGKIETLVKDSSAARNGLVTDHQILEIQGQNVIGMADKEITEVIKKAGNMITVTIIPTVIYELMMKNLRWDFVKAKMDHSIHA